MKYFSYFCIAIFAVVPLILTHQVKAESQSVLISEVQTGSATSANDEFIELYNAGVTPIDLSVWKIEYYPSTATTYGSPFRSITLSGVIGSGDYFLLASTDYLTDTADLSFAKVLAATGGTLRLVKIDTLLGTQAVDSVGWGSATLAEGTKSSAPGDGKSLSRKPLASGLQDTNNNSADFEILTVATPTSGVAPAMPEPVPVPAPTPSPDPTPPPQETPNPDPVVPIPDPVPLPAPTPPPQAPLLPLQITELLPNPVSPATDDSDEFVELYNPNDVEVSLNGYVLKTGNSLSYQQKLDGLSIGAKSYLSFFSRDTDLVLSNTSGKAVLFGPDATQVSATDPYESAPEGQSWVYTNNTWQWTTAPSPGAQNVVVAPVIKTSSSSSPIKKAATTKKATNAKSTTSKAAAKTTAAKKASSTAKPKKVAAVAGDQVSATVQGRPLHPLVLGVAGILALLYGLYEYRADIQNQIRKFRRYRSTGS